MGKAKRGRPLKQNAEALSSTYVVNQGSPGKGNDSEHEELDEMIEKEIEEEVKAAAAAKEAEEMAEEKDTDGESDEVNTSLSDSEDMSSPVKPQPKKGVKSKEKASQNKTKPEPSSKKTKQSVEKDVKIKANLAKVMKAKGKDQKVQPTKGTKSLKEVVAKKEPIYNLILEGLSHLDEKKGVTLPALKKYLTEGDEEKKWDKMKARVRKALDKGIEENLIIRPKGYENMTGLTGTFKINKKEYSKLDSFKSKSEEVAGSNASKSKSVENSSKLNTKAAKPKLPKVELVDIKSKKSKKRPLPSHRRSKSGELLLEKGSRKLKKSQSLEYLNQPAKKSKSKK